MTKKSNRYDDRRAWYAIHTYAGYEEQVADQIRQRIEGVDMANKIYNVLVPKEKMIVIKNGKRKIVEQKIFQGYVLVEMKLTEDTWFIIRNTPGVTGLLALAPLLRQLATRKLLRLNSVWVSTSQSTILICRLAKLSTLLTVHLRALRVASRKLTRLRARLRCWSVCSAAIPQLN